MFKVNNGRKVFAHNQVVDLLNAVDAYKGYLVKHNIEDNYGNFKAYVNLPDGFDISVVTLPNTYEMYDDVYVEYMLCHNGVPCYAIMSDVKRSSSRKETFRILNAICHIFTDNFDEEEALPYINKNFDYYESSTIRSILLRRKLYLKLLNL